jgi:hypothetical protein
MLFQQTEALQQALVILAAPELFLVSDGSKNLCNPWLPCCLAARDGALAVKRLSD